MKSKYTNVHDKHILKCPPPPPLKRLYQVPIVSSYRNTSTYNIYVYREDT